MNSVELIALLVEAIESPARGSKRNEALSQIKEFLEQEIETERSKTDGE